MVTEQLAQAAAASCEVEGGLSEASLSASRAVTEINTNCSEQLTPESGAFPNSDLKVKKIKDIEPTASWQRGFLLSTKKFFEYFFSFLYMSFIIKIITTFKPSNSDTVVSSISKDSQGETNTLQWEHSNDDDHNYQETQNRPTTSEGKPNLNPEIALQETKEKMSEMETRLEKQEKTVLFMKQQFHKLKTKSTKIKHRGQAEQLQALQKQLQQGCDLKKICEDQAQKIQFLELELKKNTQKSLGDSQPTNLLKEVNQLKDQLEQLRCLYQRIQRQTPPNNVSNTIETKYIDDTIWNTGSTHIVFC